MKVLLITWKGFGYEDIENAFISLGHSVSKIFLDKNNINPRHDETSEATIKTSIESFHPDFIFSFNYFPLVAHVAKETNIKYVSWIYDSPLVLLYSYTINFPTNYVFVFDKVQYNEFHNNGINTVHYLPLCADAKRLSSYDDFKYFKTTQWYNKADIAFVGSMYTEQKHDFYGRMTHITDYTKGYLEGLIATQRLVYGYDFIQSSLPASIMKDMQQDLPMSPSPDGVESMEYLFAQYVINRKITGLERIQFLTEIGKKYPIDLYTYEKDINIPNCLNRGPIDFYEGAPYVYKTAKINLNITLRSITAGVPLRVFEILGSGGFLISNYQADFEDVYTANEDYVYYESIDDLLEKIDYYLSHDKERIEIARNGLERTLNNHTYEHRISKIIDTIF